MAERSSKLRRLEKTVDQLNDIVNNLVKENYELRLQLKCEVERSNTATQQKVVNYS